MITCACVTSDKPKREQKKKTQKIILIYNNMNRTDVLSELTNVQVKHFSLFIVDSLIQ